MVAIVEQRSKKRQMTKAVGTQDAFLVTDNNSYLRDYLHFAIQKCLKAEESYTVAAQRVAGGEAQSFLHRMAELKRTEAALLGRFHPELITEEENQPSIGLMRAYWSDKEFNRIETMEDACRFALHHEQNDLRIYTRLADLEEDAAAKKLFLFLSQLQQTHVEFVQNHASIEELASVGNKFTSTSVMW